MVARHLAQLGGCARFTGSAGNAEGRAYCGRVLRELGYHVEERRFSAVALAGRYGPPVAGATAVTAITISGWLAMQSAPRGGGAVIIVAVLWLIWMPRLLSDTGLGRWAKAREGTNLTAIRGRAVPAVWLVAHIDSKWQPVSILVRAGGVIVASGAALSMSLIQVVRLVGGTVPGSVVWWVAAVGAAGAFPLLLSITADGSHGAVDNASGVAAVLLAAERLDGDAPVGILITDAEELGLVGARAFGREHEPAIMINCDTIDDMGPYVVMTVRGSSGRLVNAFQAGAHDTKLEGLRVMRLIPGILTDSVAFASTGHDSVTLSRGTVRTLARIHTRGDTLTGFRGDGIEIAAQLLADVARTLVSPTG